MERHELDPISLIFGILFLGLASTALFDNIDLTPFEARWVWPVLLIVAGAVVLVSSFGRSEPTVETVESGALGGFEDDESI